MRLARLTAVWNTVRDSLWFIPGVLTLGTVVLAVVTIQIDVAGVLPDAPAGIWLFSGTASGARGVLTAIASGFITVTGVVFSITIVALQLASTQFTPRILRNFTADRVNQFVLGIFIGTFTYALLVLRVVRGEDGGVTPADLEAGTSVAAAIAGAESTAFIPNLSVTVAVALAIISIGFLIYFIDHAARSVQASTIIDRVTEDVLDTLNRRFQERIGEPAGKEAGAMIPEARGSVITSHRSGYIQGVDEEALLDLVQDQLTIRMEPRIGDYVLPGAALVTVWPAGSADADELTDLVRSAFVLGHERTPHLDVELGVIELTDIAVKALSPGVNDPTTALLCVDRIMEVLLAAGREEPPARVRQIRGNAGGTLILPFTSFESLVDTALDEIRHYGVENPRFAFTFLDRLADLGHLLPPDRRAPVARHVAALLRTAREVIRDPADLRRVEDAGGKALTALGVGEAA